MKKFLSIVLALLVTISALTLVACGETDPPSVPPEPTVAITITVSDGSGTTFDGVKITLTSTDKTYENLTSDANGKITLSVIPGEYAVTFVNTPERFSGVDTTLNVAEAGSYDLTLEETTFYFPVDNYDEVEKALKHTATIPAHKTYRFLVMRAQGREMSIDDTTVTVKINGVVVTPTADAITFTLQGERNNMNTAGEFTITNPTDSAITISLTLYDLEPEPQPEPQPEPEPVE